VAISRRDGTITPDFWTGLYYRDVRLLSRLSTTLDEAEPQLLAAHRDGAAATVVQVAATDDYGDPTALLVRRREVAGDLRETIAVRAYSAPVHTTLRIAVEADFVAAQKSAVADPPAPVPWTVTDTGLRAEQAGFGVEVEAKPADVAIEPGTIIMTVDAAPGRPWHADLHVRCRSSRDRGRPSRARTTSTFALSTPATRWQAAVASAVADLDALCVDVPALDLAYLAAGAPWFMALFGRDTLISSWESLIAGTDVGLDVLASLARFQGTAFDGATGEQPGKILHELRTGGAEVFGVASGRAYYGTVDASALFVQLLAEAHRWGAPDEAVTGLLPAARAALAWCVEHGDIDGDGYVEYVPDAKGLGNQGWKDSGDAMVHADGSLAPAPIALAEVQAYAWGAQRGLADLEDRLGDPERAAELRRRADDLREAFQRDFWLPEAGLVAMGLDGDKRPLAVASSNMAHCLWTGMLDAQVGDAVARRLAEPDLAAAWGLRTLGAREAAYNPLGYHVGSIWPHDTALGVAGLVRYGHVDAAARLVDGLLAAAEAFGWRLPELFAGLDAGVPVPYPLACTPQAWSAAAPLSLLRTMLRLDVDVPAGRIAVAPLFADDVVLTVTGIPVGAGHLDLRIRGTEVDVLAAPDGIDVVAGAREP
jgi:glycogen debranching enzyme